jgi:excisionase family DNA binding protein
MGKSVGGVRKCLASAFGIPADALALVGGQVVGPERTLAPGEELLFLKERGHKGVGTQVWTAEEFCAFFKITPEDLAAWIAQGLEVKEVLDGSVRITETAADEFFRRARRGEGVATAKPLTVKDVAALLGISARTVYKLFEAGTLTGSRRGTGRGRVLIDPESLARYQAATATAGPASVPSPVRAPPALPLSTPTPTNPRKAAGAPAGLHHLHLP